jgi:hypothetical protein
MMRGSFSRFTPFVLHSPEVHLRNGTHFVAITCLAVVWRSLVHPRGSPRGIGPSGDWSIMTPCACRAPPPQASGIIQLPSSRKLMVASFHAPHFISSSDSPFRTVASGPWRRVKSDQGPTRTTRQVMVQASISVTAPEAYRNPVAAAAADANAHRAIGANGEQVSGKSAGFLRSFRLYERGIRRAFPAMGAVGLRFAPPRSCRSRGVCLRLGSTRRR